MGSCYLMVTVFLWDNEMFSQYIRKLELNRIAQKPKRYNQIELTGGCAHCECAEQHRIVHLKMVSFIIM